MAWVVFIYIHTVSCAGIAEVTVTRVSPWIHSLFAVG